MIRVEVIRAWPRRHESWALELPDPATVSQAVEACGAASDEICGYAVFGERVDAGAHLRDGDRVELLRALQMDPKEARRRRAHGRGGP